MPVEQQERALPRRAGRPLELLPRLLPPADPPLGDLGAVDRQDDAALLEAGLGAWAVGGDRRDQRAVLSWQAEARGDGRRHLLDLDAEPAAADLAVLLELRDDGLRDVGRHRKAD